MPRSRRIEPADVGLDRVNVFVPAVMGVGLLFWLLGEARDVVRSTSDAALDKRARIAGYHLARTVEGGPTDTDPAREGLRPRPVYLLLAVALLGGAAYVAIGSIANYARPNGYVADIAWLLAVGLITSLIAAALGTMAAMVFLTWPRPPRVLQATLAHTLLTTSPLDGADDLRRPSWRLGASFTTATAAAGLLSLMVSESGHIVQPFDTRAGDWFERFQLTGWAEATDHLFRTPVVLTLAVLVGIASLRCRVLVSSVALATAGGLVVSTALRELVDRPRPPGPLAGWTDSYPSGHLVQAVLVATFVPLALAAIGHKRTVNAPLQLVLGVVVIGTGVSRIGSSVHWATDVLGGVLIGLSLSLGTRWVMANERSHVRCRGCPWAPSLPSLPSATPDAPPHPHSLVPRGLIELTLSTAGRIRILAQASGAAVVVGLAILTVTVGLPQNGEGYVFGGAVETPVQLALAGTVSIGVLLSRRWPAVAAVVIAFAATSLGIFAAIEYPPGYALAMAGTVMVPAVLLWLSWQHARAPHELAALASVTVILLGTTWIGATTVYDDYFGPTHPASTAASVAVDRVEWVWTGGLAATSITVAAGLTGEGRTARAHVEAVDGSVRATSPTVRADANGIVQLAVTGLEPATDYRFSMAVDGVSDTGRGSGTFTTPAEGPMSFRVVLGSCARTGSNGAVFDAMAAEDALFYLALGDIHYGNIESAEPGPFRAALERLLTASGQAALYRDTPIAYIWDDHDFGPNDADSSSPGRAAAASTYRQMVPSHALVDDTAIYQAFTIGRVRFVLTDTRAERDETTMLGARQLEWLLDELTTASRSHALVVWANAVPWIGPARIGGDGWAGYAAERRTIADAIEAAEIDNLVMVSGDAHMVAVDDGTNSAYATGGGAGFPVLHAAALDRPGNIKGGPYSEGTFPGGGQYATLQIDDDGRSVTVTMGGRTWEGTTLVEYTTPIPIP